MARKKNTASEQSEKTQVVETTPTTAEIVDKLTTVDEAAKTAGVTFEDLTDFVASPAYPDSTEINFGIRDQLGLVKGVNYHFLPDGKVNWRKMIDPKYITLRKENKKEIEESTGKAFDEVSIDEVDDRYLLLLLGGIKDLLKLRGFHSVRYVNKVAQPGFVSTDCEITFIGNFETNLNEETFTDGADATPDNVEGWYAQYLTTAANNRALVRAVRNYLGIYIVGKDEVGPRSQAEQITNTPTGVDGFGPYAMLADLLKKRNRTLGQLIKFLRSKELEIEGMDDWTKLEDIPKEMVFKIVGLVKQVAES